MSKDKKHVVIVCGYGCHVDSDNPHLWGYREYLNRAFRFFQDHHTHTDALIFCGGPTQQKTAPGLTEASVMSEYTMADNFMPKVFLEEESYTTYENIKRAADIIRSQLIYSSVNITIFCEATRSPHVIRLARHFMGSLVNSIDDIIVETVSWERDVSLPKLAYKYLLAELEIRFPWLGIAKLEHRRRMLKAKIS